MTLATVVNILKEIAKVAPAALPPLFELLNSIRNAKDPAVAARRAAKAVAAPIAAKAAANKALKGKAALQRKLGMLGK